MKYFRKLITCKKLAAFLAIGMLLRATIAVGYMLDTNPADGGLFSVIICEGPAGINAIAGLDSTTDSHAQHHGHHSGHDNNNNEHDHAAQDHPVSSCSFWSASSLSLFADISFLNSSTYFLSEEIIIYESHKVSRFSNNTSFARAPPAPV